MRSFLILSLFCVSFCAHGGGHDKDPWKTDGQAFWDGDFEAELPLRAPGLSDDNDRLGDGTTTPLLPFIIDLEPLIDGDLGLLLNEGTINKETISDSSLIAECWEAEVMIPKSDFAPMSHVYQDKLVVPLSSPVTSPRVSSSPSAVVPEEHEEPRPAGKRKRSTQQLGPRKKAHVGEGASAAAVSHTTQRIKKYRLQIIAKLKRQVTTAKERSKGNKPLVKALAQLEKTLSAKKIKNIEGIQAAFQNACKKRLEEARQKSLGQLIEQLKKLSLSPQNPVRTRYSRDSQDAKTVLQKRVAAKINYLQQNHHRSKEYCALLTTFLAGCHKDDTFVDIQKKFYALQTNHPQLIPQSWADLIKKGIELDAKNIKRQQQALHAINDDAGDEDEGDDDESDV